MVMVSDKYSRIMSCELPDVCRSQIRISCIATMMGSRIVVLSDLDVAMELLERRLVAYSDRARKCSDILFSLWC